jgi:hypothetical protein
VNANAVQVVTQALKDMLTPVLGTVYVGPLDDTQAQGAKAVLFLYRVAVNPHLRNTTHVAPSPIPGEPPIEYEGSLPLDLYYLLTAGNVQEGGELASLATLGLAMQVLNAKPNLVGLPVQGETVRVTLDSVSNEDMSRIWTLFPAENYRTSVAYVASPVWIDPAVPPVSGAPVIHEQYVVGPMAS